MAPKAGRSEATLTGLVQGLLQPEERILVVGDGLSAPLEAHDGLTMALMRLTGRWREQPFAMVLTSRRLYWLELGPTDQVTRQADYKLPLKGRLVRQRPGVLEWFMPGEPRRYLHFHVPGVAARLYAEIDDQQAAVTRAHAHVAEYVGPGMKPAIAGADFAAGAHGEAVITQHETSDLIRPSFRPATPTPQG